MLVIFNVPDDLTFESAIMYNISAGMYQILLFLTLFFSSIFSLKIINKDYSFFLRFKDKESYLRLLFQSITIVNIIIYIIYSIFGLIFVYILKDNFTYSVDRIQSFKDIHFFNLFFTRIE